jgi:hypothetical protein
MEVFLMANDEERREEARRALEICVATRKRIDAYIRMVENEQEQENPDEIASCFEHLWNCDNAWALEALTGSKSGSGLCKKQWFRLSELIVQDPHSYLSLFAHHIARIRCPDTWAQFWHAREKRVGKQNMTPHYEFMRKKLNEWEQNHSGRKYR